MAESSGQDLKDRKSEDEYQDVKMGLDVLSSDKSRLGEVQAIFKAGEGGSPCFKVERGIFAHKDLYVPLGAVASVDRDAVHLKCSYAESLKMGWEKEPAHGESEPEVGAEGVAFGQDFDRPVSRG
jgi:ribosomal 30S subunit maturation factor RimM